MSKQAAIQNQLKNECEVLEELRIERSEMQQRQAKEIGVLDTVINQQWAKVSSLISLLDFQP